MLWVKEACHFKHTDLEESPEVHHTGSQVHLGKLNLVGLRKTEVPEGKLLWEDMVLYLAAVTERYRSTLKHCRLGLQHFGRGAGTDKLG